MTFNKPQHTIWAMAFLDHRSEEVLRDFFVQGCGVKARLVVRNMHCTCYHARRPIPGIADTEEPLEISVPGQELRMMVLAPGGENPRANINPRDHPIGIRIRRANGAAEPIESIRSRFLEFETPSVLGKRLPSNRLRNAFGARHFQPHITVLRSGSIVETDLSRIGSLLRSEVSQIRFDRLVVRYRSS